MRQYSAVALLASGVAAFTLTGCGSSTSPTVTSYASLSPTQQSQVNSAIASQVGASVTSFAKIGPYFPGFGYAFARVATHRATGAMQLLGSRVRPPLYKTTCITETPSSPADADADNVPDTVSLSVHCSQSDSSGSLSLTGNFNAGDPTPNTADLAFEGGGNLTLSSVSAHGRALNLAIASQTSVAQSPGVLSEGASTTLNATVTGDTANNGSVKLAASDSASYASSGVFPATFGGTFPAGTFNLAGRWGYDISTTKLTAKLSFTVATPGGLAIDPTNCTANLGSIVSGTVVVKFSDGKMVTATWTGCPAEPQYQ